MSPSPSDVESREVLVHGSGAAFAQKIVTRTHQLTADEPVPAGGSDTGPTPYELLLAALGSCTSMTIGLYARQKGWQVDAIVVRLRHAKIHAVVCAECETREGHIDRIERRIALSGNLSPEQRAKLLQIAEKCPVHKTLKSEIDIRTSLE